jgi:hypothetical protein
MRAWIAEDRPSLCGIDPVAQGIEPLVQLGPEREAIGGRQGDGHRSKAGDVLMPHLAILAMGLG